MSAATDNLATIDALIATLLADFDNITSYRIGQKEVDKHEALEVLRKLRLDYYKAVIEEPYENIQHIAFDFDDNTGEEESEYVGDELT